MGQRRSECAVTVSTDDPDAVSKRPLSGAAPQSAAPLFFKTKGIYIGSPEETWGYEVNVRSVRCAIDLNTPHSSASIGLHYEKITDSGGISYVPPLNVGDNA